MRVCHKAAKSVIMVITSEVVKTHHQFEGEPKGKLVEWLNRTRPKMKPIVAEVNSLLLPHEPSYCVLSASRRNTRRWDITDSSDEMLPAHATKLQHLAGIDTPELLSRTI